MISEDEFNSIMKHLCDDHYSQYGINNSDGRYKYYIAGMLKPGDGRAGGRLFPNAFRIQLYEHIEEFLHNKKMMQIEQAILL